MSEPYNVKELPFRTLTSPIAFQFGIQCQNRFGIQRCFTMTMMTVKMPRAMAVKPADFGMAE